MVRQNKLLLLTSVLALVFAFWFLSNKLSVDGVVSLVVTPQTSSTIEKPVTTTVATPQQIFFTGDVMLARHVELLQSRGLVQPYDFVKLFDQAAAVFINFESAMAEPHISTPSGIMKFSTSITSLPLLETLHISHASLANNHSHDYGSAGKLHAEKSLQNMHIAPFGDAVTVGTSSLTYTTVGSTTIAVLGVHTLFAKPDTAVMEQLLFEATKIADLQFVYIHWGEEYQTVHNKSQEELAYWFAQHGVDAVIGHHPHVVQDIGIVGNMPVFYSLGNFIFDQYFSEEVKTGLVLGLEVRDTGVVWRLYPQSQCAQATPCLMTKTQEDAFLVSLAHRSDSTLVAQIIGKNIEILR